MRDIERWRGTSMVKRYRALLIIAWLALSCPCATNKPATLERYIVTSWTRKDGLPSTLIYAITQTRDGYLWLGTSNGLVRFDGISFVHQRLFSNGNLLLGPVTALWAGEDGALWVGSSSGIVMRISRARRQQYRLAARGASR
jgi:ligand-binding sensor domain-containing protein